MKSDTEIRHVEDTLPESKESKMGMNNGTVARDGTEQHVDLTKATLGAMTAFDLEHGMSILDAIRLYPKAVLFSVGISIAIVMEGYDMGLMSNFFSMPQFRQKYGSQLANGDYQLSSSWQSALSSMSAVGALFGLALVGSLIEAVGFRRSMATGLILISGSIFIVFFARNATMLLVGQLVCGVPWGMFQGMASTYSADVSPLALRPLLTSYINLCWGFGAFLSTGVLKACLSRNDQWAYRIPFAVQWVWIPPIALIVFLAPESPWWLLKKDRYEEAREALRSLASPAVTDDEISDSLQLMHMTNEHEKNLGKGTSYVDLFRGTNLRRTEIASLVWVCQVTCGIWFSGQITYFMEQAGASHDMAFNFGLGMNALNCVGTISFWFIAPHLGRRLIYLLGLVGMFIGLLLVGFLAIPSPTPAYLWASGGILIVNSLLYYLSIGPLAFTIVTEIPAVRLRNRTVAVARALYLVAATGANFLHPAILNPTAWNLKGLGGFIWGGFCLLSIIYVYFRVPESKGRMPTEMDMLFEKHTPARKFKGAHVDVFGSQATVRS